MFVTKDELRVRSRQKKKKKEMKVTGNKTWDKGEIKRKVNIKPEEVKIFYLRVKKTIIKTEKNEENSD